MTQPISRLAMLMQLLDVTGREMAAALHVDHSLVSKWKNNHRKIPVRMGVISRVADFLIESDMKKIRSVIYPLLVRSENPDIHLNSLDQRSMLDLRQKLVAWLQDQAPLHHQAHHQAQPNHFTQYWQSKDQYVCPIEIFPGEAGRKKAVLNMFDTVLAMPSDTQLWVLIQENTSWVDNDPVFSAKLHRKIISLVDKKQSLHIIYWLDHQSDMIHALARDWLPLQLNPQIQSWYYPKYEPSLMPMVLFIIPEHAVLVGTCAEKHPEAMHSMILRDSASIMNFQSVFESYRKKSMPLLENHTEVRCSQLYLQLVKAGANLINKNIYVQTSSPSIVLLPGEVFKKLTRQNQILCSESFFSDRTDESVSDKFDNQPGDRKENKCQQRHVYRLNSLIQASRQAETTDPFFSMVSGETVSINQDDFKHILREMAHYLLAEDHYEIALLNDDQYQQINWPNIIHISNNLFVAWGDDESQARLSACESTIMHALETHINSRWQQIPLICKDKKRVADQLLSLCE